MYIDCRMGIDQHRRRIIVTCISYKLAIACDIDMMRMQHLAHALVDTIGS